MTNQPRESVPRNTENYWLIAYREFALLHTLSIRVDLFRHFRVGMSNLVCCLLSAVRNRGNLAAESACQHGCKRENAALTAMPSVTRPSAFKRVQTTFSPLPASMQSWATAPV